MSLTPRVCAYTLHGVYRHDLPHLPLGGSAPVLDHLAAVGCDKACRTGSGIIGWKAQVDLGCVADRGEPTGASQCRMSSLPKCWIGWSR